MIFPCTNCGCCCKRVGLVKKFLTEDEFPFDVYENGACKMLVNNMCSVYDDRPDICKVEEMAKKNNIPKEIYYKMAIDVCNRMMDEDNIPLKFRIDGI